MHRQPWIYRAGWPNRMVRLFWLRLLRWPFWSTVYAARRAWLAAFSNQHFLVTYDEVIELTKELDEHPESWHHYCACALCRSYCD